MNDNGIIGIGKFSFLHLPLAQFITLILILWVFQEIQTLLFLFIKDKKSDVRNWASDSFRFYLYYKIRKKNFCKLIKFLFSLYLIAPSDLQLPLRHWGRWQWGGSSVPFGIPFRLPVLF